MFSLLLPARGAVPSRLRRSRPVVEALEGRLALSTLLVTTAADSGPGSLRQAILDSNASTTPAVIDFGIGSGPQTITPATPLPTISNPVTIDATTQPGYAGAPQVQINGSQIFYTDPAVPPHTPIPGIHGLTITAGGSTVRGLDINRFTGNGILLLSGGNSVIAGNYLGTDLTGTISLGNTLDGIYVSDSRNNRIGGTGPTDGNVISGNGHSGVEIEPNFDSVGAGAGGNIVAGNKIGTDAAGTGDLGNSGGGVMSNTPGNVIGGLAAGAGNVIAFNSGTGVSGGAFYSGRMVNTTILSNSIFSNAVHGIQLGYEAANPVSGAVLTSAYRVPDATVVEGSFNGVPDTSLGLQFFTNTTGDPSGAGQGRALVGSATITTDDTGLGLFSVNLQALPLNVVLTATATDPDGATSEFFQNARVAGGAVSDLVVTQAVVPSQVVVGDNLVYHISVTNFGPSAAAHTVLTDVLPQGVTVTAIKADNVTAAQANNVLTVRYDKLFSGDTRSVEIDATVTTVGNLVNKVSAVSDMHAPKPEHGLSTLVTQSLPNPFPVVVVADRLLVSQHSINAVVLTFNQALDPLQARNPLNYRLVALGAGGRVVRLNAIDYNADALTVTITPSRPLLLGRRYHLELNGRGSAGLTNLGGNLLVGNTRAGAKGPYVLDVSRGAVSASPIRNGGPVVRLIETVTRRRVLKAPLTPDTAGLFATLPPLP